MKVRAAFDRRIMELARKSLKSVLVLAGAFIVLASAVTFGRAQETFESEKALNAWMMNYYLKPDPDRVGAGLLYFSDSPRFQTSGAMPMLGFFSALFRHDSRLASRVFDELNSGSSENAKLFMVNVLSLANSAEAKVLLERAKTSWQSERLQQEISRQLARPQDDLYKVPVENIQVLDMLWGEFFATGDALPIKRIISVLRLARDDRRSAFAFGTASIMAFNAKNQPRLLEIYKIELTTAEGVTKELLESIIKKATELSLQ